MKTAVARSASNPFQKTFNPIGGFCVRTENKPVIGGQITIENAVVMEVLRFETFRTGLFRREQRAIVMISVGNEMPTRYVFHAKDVFKAFMSIDLKEVFNV